MMVRIRSGGARLLESPSQRVVWGFGEMGETFEPTGRRAASNICCCRCSARPPAPHTHLAVMEVPRVHNFIMAKDPNFSPHALFKFG
jgi:hypothetical protein